MKRVAFIFGTRPEAGKLLKTQVDLVLTEPYDREAVYQARKKMTEMPLKLESLKRAD